MSRPGPCRSSFVFLWAPHTDILFCSSANLVHTPPEQVSEWPSAPALSAVLPRRLWQLLLLPHGHPFLTIARHPHGSQRDRVLLTRSWSSAWHSPTAFHRPWSEIKLLLSGVPPAPAPPSLFCHPIWSRTHSSHVTCPCLLLLVDHPFFVLAASLSVCMADPSSLQLLPKRPSSPSPERCGLKERAASLGKGQEKRRGSLGQGLVAGPAAGTLIQGALWDVWKESQQHVRGLMVGGRSF